MIRLVIIRRIKTYIPSIIIMVRMPIRIMIPSISSIIPVSITPSIVVIITVIIIPIWTFNYIYIYSYIVVAVLPPRLVRFIV